MPLGRLLSFSESRFPRIDSCRFDKGVSIVTVRLSGEHQKKVDAKA